MHEIQDEDIRRLKRHFLIELKHAGSEQTRNNANEKATSKVKMVRIGHGKVGNYLRWGKYLVCYPGKGMKFHCRMVSQVLWFVLQTALPILNKKDKILTLDAIIQAFYKNS